MSHAKRYQTGVANLLVAKELREFAVIEGSGGFGHVGFFGDEGVGER